MWVVRFGNTTKSGFHGINEVTHCTTAEAIGRLSSLWFLDSQPGWVRHHAMTTIVSNFTVVRPAACCILGSPPLPLLKVPHRAADSWFLHGQLGQTCLYAMDFLL